MKFLILLLLCMSCSGDNFQKVEKLESFRILAAITPSPEVAPNTPATIQLLVSDVNGTLPTISGTFEACIDPGISLGAPVSCDHDPARVSGAHVITFATLVPSANLRTGLNAATVNVTVPATILNGRSAREQFNGVGYIVIFRFVVNGREEVSFKRIIATSRGIQNQNPSGSAILSGGVPLAAAPTDGENLIVTSSAPESFDVINVDGSQETRLEKFEVAWYTSLGKFDKPKSFVDESVEYQGKTQTPSLIMAIVRDERGGVDFQKIDF